MDHKCEILKAYYFDFSQLIGISLIEGFTDSIKNIFVIYLDRDMSQKKINEKSLDQMKLNVESKSLSANKGKM
jgi:hypothetical protein